jgi:RNA polymerase sigma-70 factor (ECF subfamily)
MGAPKSAGAGVSCERGLDASEFARKCVSIRAVVRLICAAMRDRPVRISAAEAQRAGREREAPGSPARPSMPPNFDELVAEHRTRVARLCYRLLGWREDIEDVVQEVFLAALKGLPRFRGESAVSTWLTRIAVNACRSYLRKRLPWLRLFAQRHADPEPCLDRSPEGELANRERFERVRAAIRGLPVKYREVIVLRYLEELPVSDIGEVLGLGKGAVEVRLNRARTWLREDLAEMLEGRGDE